ncbi:MAG: ATP synthase F1 subunit delta [Chloroflexales bacterium]|nr:ATP synthase F1 subunit delta [Chloroflexales bacterium]
MATTVDAKAIAGTLYEALIGAALEQLQAAAPKLTGIAGGDVAQRVDAALPAGALPQVRNFLLGLANEGLLDQLDDVVTAFGSFSAGPPAQALAAVVTSAVELSADQQATVSADLRKRYGADTKVSFDTDTSLIGGLIIRIGDQVLDNSLRTRLSAVQRNMLTS